MMLEQRGGSSRWPSLGIRLAILIILLLDHVPIVWRHGRRLLRRRERPYKGSPSHNPTALSSNSLLVNEGQIEEDTNFATAIKGYQNSSALCRWGSVQREAGWKISIHIFAWRREKSLRRLCESLLRANFYGHEVPLYIHVDGDALDLVLHYARELYWPYGPKILNVRQERLGMPVALLSGWTPRDEDEWAILLEDDVEVAVGFFEWVLYCLSLAHHRRLVEGEWHGMMGCSLYTPRVNEIGPAPNAWSPPAWNPAHVVGPHHRLFNFQLPCSWGAVYQGRYWRQFLQYYSLRQVIGDRFPPTPNSRSNEWFSSWKRILIELMLFKGWYLAYPSFINQVSFSTNYFERGIHSVPEGRTPSIPNELRKGDRRFTVPLMNDFSFRGSLPPPSVALVKKIPWVNLYHQRVISRQHLFLDPKPFLEAAQSPELEHYFNRDAKLAEEVRGNDVVDAVSEAIPGVEHHNNGEL